MRAAAAAALLLAAARALGGDAVVGGFVEAQLAGHAAWIADNGLAVAGIGADAGARVLRFDLGGKPLLAIDASAVGDTGDPAPGGTSMWRYRETGGWRIWPGPQAQWQRHDSVFQGWPPPPALDHGRYQFFGAGDGSVDAHGPAEGNPLWRCVGLQFQHSFRLDPDAARLRITTTMTNLAGYPQRWSQWMVAAAPVTMRPDPTRADTVVWPFRAKAPSRFGPRNYLLYGGDYDDAMWQPDAAARVLRCRCLGHPGKIGGDSDGGWIARQDGADGTVLVIRFPAAAALEGRVPEGWCAVAANMMGDHAVELEAQTPEIDLDPGASSNVAWELCACRVDGAMTAVTPGGVVVEPLRVEGSGAEARIAGSFGAFARGRASLRRGAQELASWPCSPTAPLAIDQRLAVDHGQTLALEVIPEHGAAEALDTLAVP